MAFSIALGATGCVAQLDETNKGENKEESLEAADFEALGEDTSELEVLAVAAEGWHGWSPCFDGAPGNVTSVALAQGPIGGALEVFAVAGGTLYYNFLNSNGWHGWIPGFDNVPGGASRVALAQGPNSGALEVFAIASGTLYRNYHATELWSPSNVRVTGTTSSSVSLVWTDNSSIETGYKIFNVQTGSVTSTGTNVTSVTIGSLSASRSYCFDVKAYNAYGTSPTVRVCGTTQTPPPPSPKTVLVGLGKFVGYQGVIYYYGTSIIRGTMTRIRVPYQSPVTALLMVKPGWNAATVCANPQPSQVVVVL